MAEAELRWCYATDVAWRRRTAATGAPSEPVGEEDLRRLLAKDPDTGWRAFIDGYTPALLALIERAGIVDHDEAMEVYVRTCERLAANDYSALRRRDPSLGSLTGWLAVVVKHAAVDWVRSRIGRRRLFGCIRSLEPFDQRVFELYYWQGRRPAEAAELLHGEMKQDIPMDRIFAALERIDRVLSARHRAELLALVSRSRGAVPLEGDAESAAVDPPADEPDPEALLRAREREEHLARALAALPCEDAVIVSLKFVEGLTRAQIQRFLRLPELTEHRVRTIVAALRARLAETEQATSRGPRDGLQSLPATSGGHDG